MSDQDKDQERPLFEGLDEYERTYAPEQLPRDDPERQRAEEDEQGSVGAPDLEPPSAAPVATLGTSPSGAMAPPNIGHWDHGGAPGDPETEARYPIGDDRPPTTDDEAPRTEDEDEG